MWFTRNRVYMDYASSTPLREEAREAMRAAEEFYGNPNSIHKDGVRAKEVLEESRTRIAGELGCKPRELIFTSGITESNNLAILGFARALEKKGALAGSHWIVSSIEHASVLEPFREVRERGGAVSYVEPDERGIVLPKRVREALRPETVFVSVGWANNEIGTIQPLSDIAAVLASHEKSTGTRVLLHSDAGQGPLYLFAQVHTLSVDLFSFGASKLYGPHGIGALYVSSRAKLDPLILGGGQERDLRSGTESVSLAAGFAAAVLCAAGERGSESLRLAALRDLLKIKLLESVPGLVVNGDMKHALPHMLNISLPHIDGEYAVLVLDREGISASTKSACSEGEDKESHVIRALVKASAAEDSWRARSSIRFSLGKSSSGADITRVARALKPHSKMVQ